MNGKYIFIISAAFICITASTPIAHEANHKKASPEKTSHWTAPETEGKNLNPVLMSAASILRGRYLFMANCANCHGSRADGKGPDASEMDPRPTNLKVMAGHHSDGDLAWKIKTGRGDMPGWEKVLSENQIWDLVNFIQNLKSTDEGKSEIHGSTINTHGKGHTPQVHSKSQE